ncbi:hypothetical protein ACHQM5_021553 [Ranunculus cassubicifolius]
MNERKKERRGQATATGLISCFCEMYTTLFRSGRRRVKTKRRNPDRISLTSCSAMAEENSVSKEDIKAYIRRENGYVVMPRIPPCSDDNVPEIKRLAKRKIPTDLPLDFKDLHPSYDRLCSGCGRIGMETECCPRGSHAALKMCSFCLEYGHWYWKEMCPEDYPSKITCYRLWKCFKDGKPIQIRPLQIPNERRKKDLGELLRLMQRQQTKPVEKGCCTLCYLQGHPYYECPYVESIPKDAVIGPNFDKVF